MMDRGNKYLADILHSIELIELFTETIITYDDFANDLKTQSAVERQLSIIGEAVNKYDNLNPDKGLTNARQIVGFRNRLIHAYEIIDNTIIWAIIKNHLESLKQEVLGKIG